MIVLRLLSRAKAWQVYTTVNLGRGKGHCCAALADNNIPKNLPHRHVADCDSNVVAYLNVACGGVNRQMEKSKQRGWVTLRTFHRTRPEISFQGHVYVTVDHSGDSPFSPAANLVSIIPPAVANSNSTPTRSTVYPMQGAMISVFSVGLIFNEACHRR